MKKFKKTYAIYNLAEKHTTFRLGKVSVKVSFTGGIVTKKGVTPATFTTVDPIVQMAIEQSDDFKKGAIRELTRYAVEGEVLIGKNPITHALKLGAETKSSEESDGEDSEVSSALKLGAEQKEEDEVSEEIAIVENDKQEIVDASCKDVAKQYLQEHFGENPAKLRTRDDVQKCAARHGIQFNFI